MHLVADWAGGAAPGGEGSAPHTVRLSGDLLCFGRWLRRTLAAHEAARLPITNFITRASSGCGPLSSSKLPDITKTLIKQAETPI